MTECPAFQKSASAGARNTNEGLTRNLAFEGRRL